MSPGGITDLDFGDPVDAVNRVAGPAERRQRRQRRGRRPRGHVPRRLQRDVELRRRGGRRRGGVRRRWRSLSPTIDAIFNGHTHQKYVFDQPVTGGDRPTRPMVQTGSVRRQRRPDRAHLRQGHRQGRPSYTASNTARVTTSDADLITQYPVLQQVKNTVDAALANAKVVGDQPVGKISADVTTAYKGGAYTEREVRRWRARRARQGVDTGRPGRQRAARRHPRRRRARPTSASSTRAACGPSCCTPGSPAANPANTDGVVSYAEANNVLPFVNNVWLVQLTGAQLKAVLEQQWQPSGADRPYLHLGLSDNVRVTQKPGNPVGKRITSVLVNGVKTQPKKTYTVSTFSFLGQGGDNFTAFKAGKAKDTGLVDRDVWISYLKGAGTVSPDFARQQTEVSNMPTQRQAEQAVPLPGRQPRPDVAGQPAEHRGGRVRDHAGQEQAGPGEARRVPGQERPGEAQLPHPRHPLLAAVGRRRAERHGRRHLPR